MRIKRREDEFIPEEVRETPRDTPKSTSWKRLKKEWFAEAGEDVWVGL